MCVKRAIGFVSSLKIFKKLENIAIGGIGLTVTLLTSPLCILARYELFYIVPIHWAIAFGGNTCLLYSAQRKNKNMLLAYLILGMTGILLGFAVVVISFYVVIQDGSLDKEQWPILWSLYGFMILFYASEACTGIYFWIVVHRYYKQ